VSLFRGRNEFIPAGAMPAGAESDISDFWRPSPAVPRVGIVSLEMRQGDLSSDPD